MAYFTAEDLGNDDEDGLVGWKYAVGARKPNRQPDPVSAAISFATTDGTPPEWRQSPGVRSLTSRSFEAGGGPVRYFTHHSRHISMNLSLFRLIFQHQTSDADSRNNTFIITSQVTRINDRMHA